MILDELTPVHVGWVGTAEVVAAIANRPDRVNVIVTGATLLPS